MAAKYRKVDPRMWDDEKFVTLTPLEKLVAVHVFTSSSSRCGIFKHSAASAAEQCGMTLDSYQIAIGKVCHTLGWSYDIALRVIYLPTWWKYNPPENPKHLKGCLSDLHELPQTKLIKEFAANEQYLPHHCLKEFRIAMGIAMPIAMAYQKQEQKQEQNISLSPHAEAKQEPASIEEPLPDTLPGAMTGTALDDGATPFIAEKRAAWAAFDAWARNPGPLGIGREIQGELNEVRRVFDLVDAEAATPAPIIRGNDATPRHVLVPLAVQSLVESRAEFRDVKYAIGAVRNRLRDWANGSAAGRPRTSGRAGPAPPPPVIPARNRPSVTISGKI